MKMLKSENQKPKSLMLESSSSDTHAGYGQIVKAAISLAKNEGLDQSILKELLRGMVYDFDLIAKGNKWNDSKFDKITLSSLDCDRLINNGDYVSTLPKSFKKPYEDLLKASKGSKKKSTKSSSTKTASKKMEIDELLAANGLTRDDIETLKASKKKSTRTSNKKRV
tara:strand:- start:1219 stop:1719 length:501 start_codon:yes stop_codon:yes gene_type:complete